MGILYSNDLDRIQLPWFKEAAGLRGTTVKFYETIEQTGDIYTDMTIVHSDTPTLCDVMFLEFPATKKTLDMYGWYSEDPEYNPLLALVPIDLKILRRWVRVEIPARIAGKVLGYPDLENPDPSDPNFDPQPNRDRMFEVTKISTRMVYPHFWTVAMAPLFTDTSPAMDDNKNSVYFDIPDPLNIIGGNEDMISDSQWNEGREGSFSFIDLDGK